MKNVGFLFLPLVVKPQKFFPLREGGIAETYFEGSGPEWCISSTLYSGDIPFWSGALHLFSNCLPNLKWQELLLGSAQQQGCFSCMREAGWYTRQRLAFQIVRMGGDGEGEVKGMTYCHSDDCVMKHMTWCIVVQVELALDVERVIPDFIRRKAFVKRKTLKPNMYMFSNPVSRFFYSHSGITTRSLQEHLNPELVSLFALLGLPCCLQ